MWFEDKLQAPFKLYVTMPIDWAQENGDIRYVKN